MHDQRSRTSPQGSRPISYIMLTKKSGTLLALVPGPGTPALGASSLSLFEQTARIANPFT